MLLVMLLLCVAQCDTNPARCAPYQSGQPQCQPPHVGLLYQLNPRLLLLYPAADSSHLPQWYYLRSHPSLSIVTPAAAAAAATATAAPTAAVIGYQKSYLFGLKCQT
ncbi:hypothetical protein Pcinc_022149 [Petrolisthes cinctipes]|uniref:Uncharacterized protein n=1 Tax=Petrolisthes cinctipes TaxID=88211 RepID=A0AAE1FG08_PETCI|nr:hypothetical protein Pcinc_022149 [Petrolisthes cinctipes]